MKVKEGISVQNDEYTAPKLMDVLDQFFASLMGDDANYDLDSTSISFGISDLSKMMYFIIDYLVLGDEEGLLNYR